MIDIHVPVKLVAVLAHPVQILEDGDPRLPDAPCVPGVLRGQPVTVVMENGGSLCIETFKIK